MPMPILLGLGYLFIAWLRMRNRQRERHETATMQLLIDGVNSNTAGIAAGYAQQYEPAALPAGYATFSSLKHEGVFTPD